MRDRYRSALFYLFFEKRDYAAVASKYIAEPHSHKIRGRMLVHHLDNHLADTLGSSHDVRGIDRLICGNQYETLCAVLVRSHGCLISSEHVVFDRLIWTVFHKRNMLMSCRVVDNVRPVFFKNAVNAVRIAHRADQNHQIQLRKSVLKFLLNIIGIIFINIKNN